jgi:hypothetical protein
LESVRPEEPVKPEKRRQVVEEFVNDVSEGKISLGLDYRNRRPQDVEMIADIVGKFINYLNDYILGLKGGEEFEFLEKQLFFSITALRTFDAFKTSISRSKVEENLERLESKIEQSNELLNNLVIRLEKNSQTKSRRPIASAKGKSKSRKK